jgi:hypothetical protein
MHGWRQGPGRGHGWRHWHREEGLPFWARGGRWPGPEAFGWRAAFGPPTPDEEIRMLKSQAEWLRNELEAIESRISELESESS